MGETQPGFAALEIEMRNTIAAQDTEIARLKEELEDARADVEARDREIAGADLAIGQFKADLARVRGQRDRLALGYAATPSALKSVGLRIVGGTVEEIES